MSDMTEEVLKRSLPVTQDIAALLGDLSASEIVWIDEKIAEALTANSRLPSEEEIARAICRVAEPDDDPDRVVPARALPLRRVDTPKWQLYDAQARAVLSLLKGAPNE